MKVASGNFRGNKVFPHTCHPHPHPEADIEEQAIEKVDEKLEEAGESKSKAGRCVSFLGKVGGFISSFGVKMKILVSLYQVLTGLGMTFNIPYPDNYTEWLSKISAIELDSEPDTLHARSMRLVHSPLPAHTRICHSLTLLNPSCSDRPLLTTSHPTLPATFTAHPPVPALLPLDCLLGGINFMHTLLIQTIGPLAVVGVLELAAKVLYKKAAMEAAKAAREDAPPPTSAFLAELCSNVSFFLLFLLYPGCSAKIFNALLCNTFNGEGENGESFLRVVSRQHPRPFPVLVISSPSHASLARLPRRISRSIANRRSTKDLSFRTRSA